MKITKTAIAVFLSAFLIGYVSIMTIKKESMPSLQPQIEVVETFPVPHLPFQPIEINFPLPRVKEVNSWANEGKYPFKIKLIETGERFHGDEIDAKNGEIWMGLFKEGDGYSLRPSKIKVRRVYDSIVDDNERKKTGKSVSVPGDAEPLFLLKNASNLRAGNVATLFRGMTWQDVYKDEKSELTPAEMVTTMHENFVQRYELGGKKYELKVIDALNEKDEKISALVLESAGKRQVLHTSIEGGEDGLGLLFWVGDLDRDNKPDFYMSLSVHYNVGNHNLFLSSKAGKNELVKLVANFWTTGC
jgi:hypothetical protein